jgi:hypothetical protein
MSFEPRHVRACFRLDEAEPRAWTFADLLRTRDGDGDPEAFDALCDTFCALVGAPSCAVTDPDADGRIWFVALAA